MWTRNDLLGIFELGQERPAYLNFQVSDDIRTSRAIQNREQATSKSLQEEALAEVAALEGSPSFEVIKSMFDSIFKLGILPEFNGIGLELGSGIGLLSAAVLVNDRNNVVKGIIALEAGLPFVEEGIERAAKEILGDQSLKIMPCHSSFDKIEIESESIDFILQIEALHHADSLHPPIREAFRILKKGGFLLSIDRSWPDIVKDSTLQELINHEYEKEWLIKKGFPSDKPFTRGDNGEHEYRDIEWKEAFKSAGFEIKSIVFLHPRVEKFHMVKRIVGLLMLNRIFKIKIPSRRGLFRALMDKKMSIRFPGRLLISAHPRPLTVFVLRK